MERFKPQVGLVTNDCYLHGINKVDNICNKGVIENVGIDYFILRDKEINEPLFISKGSYWVIETEDFKEPWE